MGSFVRIFSLLWADILVGYAFFVMQNYLTDVWELSFTRSAGIMNIFSGICLILPVFFQFLVDAIIGNFTMLVLSSVTYSLGISFIFMSTPPVLANSTSTCKQYNSNCIGHTQKVLFYTGMALVSVGVAGNRVSVRPFIKEQMDNPEEGLTVNNACQLPGFILIVITPIVGAIALPYIKPWSVRFGIPAICTVFATLLFFTGCCTFRKIEPQGSPMSNVCRVYVAFFTKICKSFPLDDRVYWQGPQGDQNPQLFTRTRCLRWLEKAAIDTTPENPVKNRWRVCSVAEVEEAKIALRMIPMWMTFIVCGIISSFGNTYFVEQANNMNRKIGKWNLPPQILLLFYNFSKSYFDKLATSFLSSPTVVNSRKGIRAVFGIGFSMIFSILCCITSARFEMMRLDVIKSHGLLDRPKDDIPMSVYWLLFQFFLLAGLDSFLEKSIADFYECQAPRSMTNYLQHFTNGVKGLGYMFSMLSVYAVGQISKRGGRHNWFQFTLSRSRLDRYYWVLAGLGAVNLVIFVVVASLYRYKNWEMRENVGAEVGEASGPAGDENGGENGVDNSGENGGENGEIELRTVG